MNSAALLLRSANDRHPNGLANSSGMVGTRYMAHLATMMQGVGWRVNHDEFQKTLAINDFYLRGPDTPYPLGQIQSQGRTDARMAKVVGDGWRYKFIEMRHIPLWAYEMWVSRATDWLAMTEDLPQPENRVTIGAGGRTMLEYRPNNLRAHAQLVDELRGLLGRLGYWSPRIFAHSIGAQNTTHQCGTLCFGTDPRTSVLDPFCRTHDIENLFVVDASFFPSSAAVNPGLTIIAQALRVADHLTDERPHVERGLQTARRICESTIVQPRRHHRVRLQQGRSLLLGGLRLSRSSASRTRRPSASARSSASKGPQPSCKIGWIRVPGGAVLEIFEFQPQLPPAAIPWNKVGLTHISFNVRNLARWHDYLVSKGVECVSKPERSPRGHSFFFAKDFDGNLIELMDLGHMYYVLGWLGPLGGWIFRRGMYKKYYETSGLKSGPDIRRGNIRRDSGVQDGMRRRLLVSALLIALPVTFMAQAGPASST